MIQLSNTCYGCGMCAAVCPKSVLKFTLNKDGFYTPALTSDNICVDCHLCSVCCPCGDDKIAPVNDKIDPESFSAWSLNPVTRFQSSSGGIAFEICSHLLSQNYKVCGVVYDSEKRLAKHVIIDNIELLTQMMGSKYIPSYTKDAFEQLKKAGQYVVIGTPCQIDALRRYTTNVGRSDDYVLIDFFCHGVPSMNLWHKYIQREEQIHKMPMKDIAWRNKATGWHDSWNMTSKYQKSSGEYLTFESPKSKGDLFYWFFLGNYCLNSYCYDHCKYKLDHSAADLRIGDLWGKRFKQNDFGVSGVLILSDKGRNILHKMNGCHVHQEKKDVVLEGQMTKGAERPWGATYARNALKTDKPLDIIAKGCWFINLIFNLPHKLSRRLFKRR